MKTIFVSSTFRDMQFERDLIHERIAPAINARAAEVGDHISFCDLRWGINTLDYEQEESSRKVLRVCLDEIDRCRPYMMIIIGARYGWIPSEDLIRYGIRGRNLELEDFRRSVTELEIIYGALTRKEDLDHVFVYFRNISGPAPKVYEPEDAEHLAKLEALKARLWNVVGSRIREYTVSWDPEIGTFGSEEEFENLVRQDLLESFEKEWRQIQCLSPCEKMLRMQYSYAEQKEYPLSSRDTLAREYLAEASNTSVFAVSGESGSGKTALLSRMIRILKKQGAEVLPIFSGISKECNDGYDLLQFMCTFLEDRLGINNNKDLDGDGYDNSDLAQNRSRSSLMGISELRERLIYLAARYSDTIDRELYIVIDAIDQLFPDEVRDSLLFMVPYPGENIHYIVSFIDSFTFNRPAVYRQIPMPDISEREQMIRGILQWNRREVDDRVLDSILQKKSLSTPLYAGLLMQRLQMLSKEDFDEIHDAGGGMKAISDHQQRIIEEFPDDIENGAWELINTAAKLVGGNSVKVALCLLAFTRHGLRQEDLFAIMEREHVNYNGLDFSQFIQFLNDFFLLRDDGRYDFTHARLRDCIKKIGNEKVLYEALFQHFSSLEDTDPVKIQEIGYHAIKAEKNEYLKERCVRSTGASRSNLFADLREQCMLDDTVYLTKLLCSEKIGNSFWWFTLDMLREAFVQSEEETEIKYIALSIMHEFMATKVLNNSSEDSSPGIKALEYLDAEICEMMGDCCYTISGIEGHEKATENYDKAKEALEKAKVNTEDYLNNSIRLMVKSSKNYVAIHKQDDAYRDAMEGIRLSLQYYSYDCLPELYLYAAQSKYYVGIQEKYFRKKLFNRHKGNKELQEAVEICANGKTVLSGMYDRGEFTQAQIMQYAEFLKFYGDVITALAGKENVQEAVQLHKEAVELCDGIDDPWNLHNANVLFDVYTILVSDAIGEVISGSFNLDNLRKGASYALKALEIAEYFYRQLKTRDAMVSKSLALTHACVIYIGMKEEPREGQLDEWTRENVKLAEEIMRNDVTSSSMSAYSCSHTVRSLYLLMAGGGSCFPDALKSQLFMPGINVLYYRFAMKAWRKLPK